MSKPDDYGNHYWCIKTDLSEDGEIYVFADSVEVSHNGDLILWKNREGEKIQNLVIARANWKIIYAASVIDGSALAVMHWQGEVIR